MNQPNRTKESKSWKPVVESREWNEQNNAKQEPCSFKLLILANFISFYFCHSFPIEYSFWGNTGASLREFPISARNDSRPIHWPFFKPRFQQILTVASTTSTLRSFNLIWLMPMMLWCSGSRWITLFFNWCVIIKIFPTWIGKWVQGSLSQWSISRVELDFIIWTWRLNVEKEIEGNASYAEE